VNKRSSIESRKKIIHAAMNVFSRHGYAKANIREIAKRAGISIGGIYLHFKNKENLYRSLINEGRRDMGERIDAAVEQTQSATQALSNLFKLYFEYALKHKEFTLLHIREHGFTFGMDEKRQFFSKQRKLVERIIQRGIRSAEFRKCNAGDMAKVIMGSLRGIILSMALDDDVIITPGMINEFILEGLRKKDNNKYLHN
jgi:TetR/AcrR family transcriptional regulator